MTAENPAPGERTARLLKRLAKGLERRHALEGAARVEVDRQIVEVLDEIVEVERQVSIDFLGSPPPRRVATSLATALFTQPHLAVMLRDLAVVGTEPIEGLLDGPVEETPILVAPEVLQDALGLPNWELEDIREDVDRRVGLVLKQSRALKWLWDHFGLPESSPEPLFRVLFPGAPGRIGGIDIARRGPQLYAFIVQDAVPPREALYLPWVPVDEEKSFHPLCTFRGKYVNANLRRAMGRGVGASEEETIELLDRMITILPRGAAPTFLLHDTWRARGMAGITDVPAPYGEASWLVRPLEPDDVPFAAWLVRDDDGKLLTKEVRAAFDVLAVPRVNEMLRQVYAELISRLHTEPADATGHSVDDLVLFDLERHLRSVLRPLLDWASSFKTAEHVAAQVGADVDEVSDLLTEAGKQWRAQLESAWVGVASDDHRTVQTLLTMHLLLTRDALRRTLQRRRDPRAPHRDVLLLFAAIFLSQSPLERLWSDSTENATWPALPWRTTDIVSQFFWGAWNRVLDTVDDDVTIP